MKLKLLILFIIVNLNLHSQESNNFIEYKYTEYFQNSREIPYLHLNKTTFMRGENIWFQAYIYEQNNKKLHLSTSNLYITLFDNKGNIKDQQLIKINKGIGIGNIKIDSSFKNQKYYIKASTNWMCNFKEDNSFIQEVNILSSVKIDTNNSKKSDSIDFQLFPEGGHCIESVNNNITILIKNNSRKGIKINNGVVKDKSNKIITTFKTNEFGIGSVNFYYEPNNEYVFEYQSFNNLIQKRLTIAKKLGVTLSVENPNTVFVKITINTNDKTKPLLIGKKYTVLIHNTSTYYKSEVVFNVKDNTYILLVKNKKLPKGINIITIFNDQNQPILERTIFNYNKNLFSKIDISSSKFELDSLSFLIKNNEFEKTFLSISVLPIKTKAYNPKSNIYSSFLLNPYIKGNVQNSNYYFKNVNRKKLMHLDLLLKTQGWSKYRWKDIFKGSTKINYNFENGVSIKGKINSNNKNNISNIFLSSKKSNLFKSTNIRDNQFEFKNLQLLKNEELIFTILKNKTVKDLKNVYLKFFPSFKNLTIDSLIFTSKKIDPSQNLSEFIYGDTELLNEVIIKTKIKKTDARTNTGLNLKSYKPKDMPAKSQKLVTFLRAKGFRVDQVGPNITIRNQRGQSSLQGSGFFSPNIFLDGMQIASNYFTTDLNIIALSDTQDFEEILISKMLNGEIHLFSKKYSNSDKKINKVNKHFVPFGFSSSKEYYMPKYYSTSNKAFNHFGAIFWKSNISIKAGKSFKIKSPSLKNKSLKLFIEGITQSGKLISFEKILNTPLDSQKKKIEKTKN